MATVLAKTHPRLFEDILSDLSEGVPEWEIARDRGVDLSKVYQVIQQAALHPLDDVAVLRNKTATLKQMALDRLIEKIDDDDVTPRVLSSILKETSDQLHQMSGIGPANPTSDQPTVQDAKDLLERLRTDPSTIVVEADEEPTIPQSLQSLPDVET